MVGAPGRRRVHLGGAITALTLQAHRLPPPDPTGEPRQDLPGRLVLDRQLGPRRLGLEASEIVFASTSRSEHLYECFGEWRMDGIYTYLGSENHEPPPFRRPCLP